MNKLETMKEYLKTIDSVIANGKYKDNWESLANHKVPDWYQNAKFGIFIHWGVYSVPAYGSEWYPRYMYIPNVNRKGKYMYEHHCSTFGAPKEFGYKDFIPMFKAEKFDAAAWADIFKKAGAKFVMPVAEHHDGFQMYDSRLSDWCASKMGPKKDIVGLLKTQIEKNDMVFTASSHRVEHYWFLGGGRLIESDMPPAGEEIPYEDMYWPSVPDNYTIQYHQKHPEAKVDKLFMEDWLARTCEIVDKYHPKIMYFDGWIEIYAMKPYLKKFAAYYYNRAEEWGEEVTINFKHDAFLYSAGVNDIERGQLANIAPSLWQNDTSVANNSWGYTEDNHYKKPNEIICDLIDIVSKNGSLLLNIGPKADGTIPEEDKNILLSIGKWLSVNGEGIYNSSYWKKFGEGPTTVAEGFMTDMNRDSFTPEDFRFTINKDNLYVFCLNWPEDGVVRIKTLGKNSTYFRAIINSVKVLGSESECKYKLCDDYLSVMCDNMTSGNPVCIKINIC